MSFDANLYSSDGVILDDPGVDVLDIRLHDVVIHVVEGADDARPQPVSRLQYHDQHHYYYYHHHHLHSRVVVEPEEVAVLIFQEFVLIRSFSDL